MFTSNESANDPENRVSRRNVMLAAAAVGAAATTTSHTRANSRQKEPALNVIPAPRTVETLSESTVSITTESSVSAGDASLQPIVDWFTTQVHQLASIKLSTQTATGPAIEFVLDDQMESPTATTGVRADDEAMDRERYELDISTEAVRVVGATSEGVFRGATTLLQLIADTAEDGVADLEGVTIVDSPRFAWRGLNMDVVRTFHPVDTVKKVIDLLALYKMNVLHLHLTDTEGWRFEVPDFPELTDVSGKTALGDRPGGHFSQDDYAEILKYASAHFVTVVPEFDSPGHTASVLKAYPDLGSQEMHDAPEAMQYLDPDTPGVWDLVGAVYDEMARVHPGARLHVGGDEAIAMDEELFSQYMETALPMARGTGKDIVAWQETARAGFSDGDLMQWWIPEHLIERVQEAAKDPENSSFGQAFPDPDVRDAFFKLFLQAPDDLPKALSQGAGIIISQAGKLYLDTKYTEDSADPKQAEDHERVGLPPSVYGNGTVQDSYDWDPATMDADLPVDRIAGIEAAIWCETVEDESDLMMQILPRLPGVAEKGWSDSREWTDYHPRLAAQRHAWDAMDVNYFVSSVVWPEG